MGDFCTKEVLQMRASIFHGANATFWIGVVEERDDSTAEDKLKLGRCKVRLLGYHSEKKTEDDAAGEGIPTKDLHWAYPINALASASVSGIGQSPLGPVEGTWVFGCAIDGMAMQELYMLGTLVGVPKERLNPNDQGFCDPNDKYPLDEWIGESDVHRLARNESTGKTSLRDKESSIENSVRTASGGTWSEPKAPYDAKYPFNHVKYSESGHLEEWDDTEGAERVNREHMSGTFEEWHPDGSEVRKIKGDGYEIHLKDRNMLVKGDLNITVEGDAKILSKGNMYIESSKDIDFKAMGKINMWALRGVNIISPKTVNIIGIFGVRIGAVLGPASMASPVNQGQGTAKAVG